MKRGCRYAAVRVAVLTATAFCVCLPCRAAAAEPGADEAAAWVASLPATAAERLRLAAAALDRGDAETALKIYELVSGEGEYLEAETGQVRAALANGETRKAVAYGSRVADENRDSLEAQLLLVYLVDRTGKPEFALENLERMKASDAAQARLLASVRAELLIDRGRAVEALEGLEALPPDAQDAGVQALRGRAERALGRIPAAPRPAAGSAAAWPAFYTEPAQALTRTAAAAGGVAIDAGRRVLTRLSAPAGTAVVVRNGLGLTRTGVVVAPATPAPVTVVRLDRPFPAAMAIADTAVGRAEGTRFCFTLGNRVADPDRRGVPAVYPGIVFRRLGDTPYIAVTADTGGDLAGAPLFDAGGRLVALAAGTGRSVGQAETALVAVPTEAFAGPVGLALASAPAADGDSGALRPTVVELHERLSPSTVQVFVVSPPRKGGQ